MLELFAVKTHQLFLMSICVYLCFDYGHVTCEKPVNQIILCLEYVRLKDERANVLLDHVICALLGHFNAIFIQL